MHPIVGQLLQRLAFGVLMLLGVSGGLFLGVEALPGDTAATILGQSATPQALQNLRLQLGLDQPPLTRYFQWLRGILSGDLGRALSNGADIASAIGQRLGNTLFLAGAAAVVAVPVSLLLGVIAARHTGRWPDKLISATTLTTVSLPEFVAAYFIVYLFAVVLPIFNPVAMMFPGMSFFEKLRVVALPATVLVLVSVAHMMRMTRAAILNVMQSAYIETAQLKGIAPMSIVWKHALPNAIAPIVSVIALNLAYLIVGTVVVEVVFSFNGLGQYLVDHVSQRDLPVVQAVGLIFAAVYIGINIVADLISYIANPRLRHPR